MERSFVLTLHFDPATFARLDALRRAHFPPDRNLVPAHLTLFHRLVGEVEASISAATERPPIPLRFTRVQRLGRGAALAVDSADLIGLRADLARVFADQLTAQDRQPYRPHVTIQNKAEVEAARTTHEALTTGFEPWDGLGVGLLLWRYVGGPWRPEAEFTFR